MHGEAIFDLYSYGRTTRRINLAYNNPIFVVISGKPKLSFVVVRTDVCVRNVCKFWIPLEWHELTLYGRKGVQIAYTVEFKVANKICQTIYVKEKWTWRYFIKRIIKWNLLSMHCGQQSPSNVFSSKFWVEKKRKGETVKAEFHTIPHVFTSTLS